MTEQQIYDAGLHGDSCLSDPLPDRGDDPGLHHHARTLAMKWLVGQWFRC
jgi:hypothetical protein